jgi:hypothetical protein
MNLQTFLILIIGFNLLGGCVKQGVPEEVATQAAGSPGGQGPGGTDNNNTSDNDGNIVSIIDSELNFSSEDPKVGIKNFEQIVATFESVTGISRNDNDIRTILKDVLKLSMPMENKIIQFSAANQSAIMKTAYLFCFERTRAVADVSAFWPSQIATAQTAAGGPFTGFHPDSHSNQFSNAAVKNYFIETSLTKFYGMKFLSEPEKVIVRNEISEFLEELRVGYESSALAQRDRNIRIARAVCSTMLSSFHLTQL